MPRISFNVRTSLAMLCCCLTASASFLCACKAVSEEDIMGGINTTVITESLVFEDKPEAEAFTGESAAPPAESAETSASADTTQHTVQQESPAETASVTAAETAPPETAVPETAAVMTELTVTNTETTAAVTSASSITEMSAPAAATSKAPAAEPAVNYFGANSYSALNFREQKGIWFSFLEYDSIMKNKSASSFRSSIGECFDNVKDLGFNTVYTQVRAYGDAYYDSELFPSGDRFNGTMGTSQSYDALAIMVEEAHSRGLSIHAWINPMRLMTETQLSSLDDSFAVKKWYNDPDKKGKYIVYTNSRWYLNPAYKEVNSLIADGISEIVSNYDVDGVQIDDYFYPTMSASFDSDAYNASGTELSLSSWRTENVNRMVKKLCGAVHSANPSAVFGISPQGSISNNYNELYADVRKWCADSSYCDYILPQVYFGFDNAGLPYSKTIKEWSEMTTGNVKLVIGLAGYKIGLTDNYGGADGKNEWINNSDIISRQMQEAAKLGNYGGVAVFRYGSLFSPDSSVAKQVNKELEGIRKNG